MRKDVLDQGFRISAGTEYSCTLERMLFDSRELLKIEIVEEAYSSPILDVPTEA